MIKASLSYLKQIRSILLWNFMWSKATITIKYEIMLFRLVVSEIMLSIVLKHYIFLWTYHISTLFLRGDFGVHFVCPKIASYITYKILNFSPFFPAYTSEHNHIKKKKVKTAIFFNIIQKKAKEKYQYWFNFRFSLVERAKKKRDEKYWKNKKCFNFLPYMFC